MTLIKSISGIRGTIGGKAGETLSPIDIVKFTSAFATWLKNIQPENTVIIGRDARPSGQLISRLVASTLQACGIDVVDIGLTTTPTIEIAITMAQAQGGIMITASHNPANWNAIKLFNQDGEFVSPETMHQILAIAQAEDFDYVENKKIGSLTSDDTYLQKHIEAILKLPLVDVEIIKQRNFSLIIDCVNSTGGIAVPMLLEALGVEKITKLHCEPDGNFAHNPEPLPENLTDIAREMERGKFDLGIVVDPDVDRLALLCEDGSMFGEEYTLVAVADYVLKHQPGATVSNLSSTRALRDITEQAGQKYYASAVGEVNVVKMMKEVNAVIGGEGNGGVILPELHYGRDALVGIALFLTHLAKFGKPISMLKATYPKYYISKNKITLSAEIDTNTILESIKQRYQNQPINDIDGVKIEFDKSWVHLRQSNTEPIIRIYAEAESESIADTLAKKIMQDIKELITPQ
ncbi:MAG: phosphoglucosamine mutase [Microscillaceae bacterium]|nr:phosphoglucosamine mutase [Microscillaceae bacterium]MDW8459571.1 phosphoglucosamine mutase [Cytophagales bacterium]